MDDNQIMRETLAALTGFCSGSELNGPDDSEERLGYAWHADGWPDGFGDLGLPAECSEADGWADRFTGIGNGLSTPKETTGWTLVGRFPLGERVCPWLESEEEHGDGCPLCEGAGVVYLGEETTLDLYARWNVDRWASEASEHMTHRDGRWFIADDAPAWMEELREAAGSACNYDAAAIDTQYRLLQETLSDAGSGTLDPCEIADSSVPVYNAQRTAWLAESLAHAGWVDDAQSEGLVSDDADLFDRIAAGMYQQAYAVASAVLEALQTLRDDA